MSRVTWNPDHVLVENDSWRVRARLDRPRAAFAATGRDTWHDLLLAASVDRAGIPDETVGFDRLDVDESPDEVVLSWSLRTSAWDEKTVTLRIGAALDLAVSVRGNGRIGRVTLGGGRVVMPNGASGVFRSAIDHAALFVPAPTEPIAPVRPATEPAVIGVVGDADPGRLNGVFSPAPLCFGFGDDRDAVHAAAASDNLVGTSGDWLCVGVLGAVETLGFTQLSYEPLDGGWLLSMDFEGHSRVEGTWESPVVTIQAATSPVDVIARLRTRVPTPPDTVVPAWWLEPIFCGWGAQCTRAAAINREVEANAGGAGLVGGNTAASAPALARAEYYDEWLDLMGSAGLTPGTIVIDDQWQSSYGTFEVNEDRWPDMRGWIARRHAAGQRVLLWFKAWDPQGLPSPWCVRDAFGRDVAADPSNPEYLDYLAARVVWMLGPDGLDADGFKVDFTQRTPSGYTLTAHQDGVWGVAALHRLMGTVYRAAKAVKPDALIVNHTPDPRFADVTDMIRLNDVLSAGPDGARVPGISQARFRQAVAGAAQPGTPVDTDQWPLQNVADWRAYVAGQPELGVPALYYLEGIDNSGETLGMDDLAVVARSWADYRERIGR